jgi:hypothetical protein
MMIALSLGSHGDEVRRVEQRLKELTFYTGAIDGAFGGGVQSAVKAFQKANGLPPDGVVGPRTWSVLLPGAEPPAAPSLASQPITQRCLALTGTFETSTGAPDCYCGVAGNFDKQGLSFGVLQWNLGQGTLQPLLSEMVSAHREVAETIFQENLGGVVAMLAATRPEQLRWAQSIQDPRRFTVFEPWSGFFKALGRTTEFQAIQVEHAERIRQNAVAMCQQFGVGTERALALMFDICVQNGSIGRATSAKIRADFDGIAAADPAGVEVARLRSIANRRAEAASRAFVEDVRVRKLAIANGEGIVHNIPYNLEQQFGIRLVPFNA